MVERLIQVLEELAAKLGDKLANANEAKTRLQVIDRILFDGLGWDPETADVEAPVAVASASKEQKLYLDYALRHRGTPYLVVEAKRKSKTFALPADLDRREYSLKTLLHHCGENLNEVINQAHNYAVAEGIPYAAVTNGHQWVVFRPHIAFQSWLLGTAVVFRGSKDLLDNASRFAAALGPHAFASGDIDTQLKLPQLPAPTFAKTFNDARGNDPGIEENVLAKPFNTVFPLFFDSLTGEGDEQALRECYVTLTPLRSHAKEFAALLQRSIPHYLPPGAKPAIRDSALAPALNEAITEDKPSVIILVGSVGAGKSTFVHHLLRVHLPGNSAAYWHIEDFIDDYQSLSVEIEAPALERRIYTSLLTWIEKTFPSLSPYAYENLKKMFHREVSRLAHGARKREFEKNPEVYVRAEAEVLDRLSSNPEQLALAFLKHARESLGRPVCVAFDNVDRGSEAFQQFLYTFAHRLSRESQCNVIVTMRYNVYEAARMHGVLDTRNDIVFHVTAPSLQSIFSKRIRFARRYLERSSTTIKGLSGIEPARIADFLDVINELLLGEHAEVRTCLESLSSGNIRQAFDHFKRFATSGHTHVDELILTYNKARDSKAKARFYFHDYFRPFVLGSNHRYHKSKSPLVNLFSVADGRRESHFTKLRVLSLLLHRYRRAPEGKERGETSLGELVSSLASCGHYEPATLAATSELCARDLVERLTSSRRPFGRTDIVKLSAAGMYYLNTLLVTPAYLYYVSQDTVIYRADHFKTLREALKTYERDRNDPMPTVAAFIDYLLAEETSERARFGPVAPVRSDWDRDFAREMRIVVLDVKDIDETDRSRDLAQKKLASPVRAIPSQLTMGAVLDAADGQLEKVLADVVSPTQESQNSIAAALGAVQWSLYVAYCAGIGPLPISQIVEYATTHGSATLDSQLVRRLLTSDLPKYQHLIIAVGDARFTLTPSGLMAAAERFKRK